MVDENEKKRNKIIREYATEMLINATARFCDDVTEAKENGLTPLIVKRLKGHLRMMEKTIDVAEDCFNDDALHGILVSLLNKKKAEPTDQETDKEPTEDAPIQDEPYQKPEVLDEPPADTSEEQKEQQ